MELSAEAYHLVVSHVGDRRDLCALCTVSKTFQRAAERALYNTLHLSDQDGAIAMCELLARQARLSILVRALTVVATDEEDYDGEPAPPGRTYWDALAAALRALTRLRFLNIHLECTGSAARAWVLTDCAFQLHAFHCDLAWDAPLAAFLAGQRALADLFVADFAPALPENARVALPALRTLECTFTEAAALLAPGRPLARLKTCFSGASAADKRAELAALLAGVARAAAPLTALDLADAGYSEAFAMETLARVSQLGALRYLGTLVLPVAGRERLRFYGMLMRLPRLRCVELEVSEWVPPPTSRAALRALASELRLYCPAVECVVFVHEFERRMVRVQGGVCVLVEGENGNGAEGMWREDW